MLKYIFLVTILGILFTIGQTSNIEVDLIPITIGVGDVEFVELKSKNIERWAPACAKGFSKIEADFVCQAEGYSGCDSYGARKKAKISTDPNISFVYINCEPRFNTTSECTISKMEDNCAKKGINNAWVYVVCKKEVTTSGSEATEEITPESTTLLLVAILNFLAYRRFRKT